MHERVAMCTSMKDDSDDDKRKTEQRAHWGGQRHDYNSIVRLVKEALFVKTEKKLTSTIPKDGHSNSFARPLEQIIVTLCGESIVSIPFLSCTLRF